MTLRRFRKPLTQIKTVLQTVAGMADLSVFDAFGQPTVNIDIDRNVAARYGLAPGDINSTVQAAIGSQTAGNLYECGSDRNFPCFIGNEPRGPPLTRRWRSIAVR